MNRSHRQGSTRSGLCYSSLDSSQRVMDLKHPMVRKGKCCEDVDDDDDDDDDGFQL